MREGGGKGLMDEKIRARLWCTHKIATLLSFLNNASLVRQMLTHRSICTAFTAKKSGKTLTTLRDLGDLLLNLIFTSSSGIPQDSLISLQAPRWWIPVLVPVKPLLFRSKSDKHTVNVCQFLKNGRSRLKESLS